MPLPDVFAAALLNSQPMGFYAPAQIVRDAQEHGVDVRPVDVNLSDWDCTWKEGLKAAERRIAPCQMRDDVRTDMRCVSASAQISGFSEDDGRPSKASAAKVSIPCAISGCARG